MTRTNNEPELSNEPNAIFGSLAPTKQAQFGKTRPLDPPPRAAARHRGAAFGVEGPGRAQRQRREHDRPCSDALRKEQHLSWIEHRTSNPRVVGSNPTGRATLRKANVGWFFHRRVEVASPPGMIARQLLTQPILYFEARDTPKFPSVVRRQDVAQR